VIRTSTRTDLGWENFAEAGRWQPSVANSCALAVVLFLLPLAVGSAFPGPSTPLTPGSSGIGVFANTTCLPHHTTSPSSLLIPLASPSGRQATLTAGTVFGAQFEYQATHLPPNHNTKFTVPSVTAVFPLSGGGSQTFFFTHRSFVLTGGGWSNPVSVNHTLSANVTFSTTSAHLTTTWLAVMANATYGTAQIQFQWQWWIKPSGSGGHVQLGPWSHAINTANSTEQPTTFYPAPLVNVVSTSGSSQLSGMNYTADLSGNVSNTHFRMLVETPGGSELNSVCLVTPAVATTFNASLPLTNWNGTPLPPGKYLIHALNAGAAIVVFEKVTVL
jgi:hypothetical protein